MLNNENPRAAQVLHLCASPVNGDPMTNDIYTEQLRQIIQIDDNIEMIRKDMREYCKQQRETIRDLQRRKAQARQELGQLPLFENRENDRG